MVTEPDTTNQQYGGAIGAGSPGSVRTYYVTILGHIACRL